MRLLFRFCLAPVLLLMLLLAGCAAPPDEDARPYFSLAGTEPDTVAALLAALDSIPAEEMTDCQRAWRSLCRICLQDKLEADTLGPQSLIDSAVDYYEKSRQPALATAYFYKARSLYYKNDYDASVPFYFKAEELAEQWEDYPMLARINMDLGDIGLYQKYHAKARDRYQKALKYFEQIGEIVGHINALTGIGYSYMYIDENGPDKALPYFYEAANLAAADAAEFGIVLYEIGLAHYKMNRMDSAKYYLQRSEAVYGNHSVVQPRSYYLAAIHFENGQLDSAAYYADLGINLATNIYVQRICYSIKADIADSLGNHDEADLCRRHMLVCSDSILQIEREQHEAYVYESEYHAEKARVRTRNRWIASVAAGLSVLGAAWLAAWLLWRRKKTRYKETETAGLQTEAERNSLIAERFATLAGKIASRAQALQQQGADYEVALRAAHQELLAWDNHAAFCKTLNRRFNGLASKLQGQYPQLDERDMQLCILHMFQTSNKDIAILLYISINSVGNTKTRLAKKLGVSSAREMTLLMYDIFASRNLPEKR